MTDFTWDELDKAFATAPDAVIHLAGLAHDTRNTLNEDAYFKVNFELTKDLYERFLKTDAAGKFIYVSSVKAVADKVQGELDENFSPAPATPYGASKLKAEEYIRQLSMGVAAKQYYILRPCMVHGPGNKGNLNLLYKFVEKGLPYPLGSYNNRRSFLSIENFCDVCKRLLTNNIPSGVYNLADDEPISTVELFSIISSVIGKKARVLNVPRGLVGMMAGLGDKLGLPFNTERLDKLTENYVVSNDKIKKALGLTTMPVTTQEGLVKTIRSFAG